MIYPKLLEYLNENPIPAFSDIPHPSDRAAWEGLPQKERENIVALAEKNLGTPFPQLLITYGLDFERTGDRQAFEGPYFERRRRLQLATVAECIEYKGRFLDEITNAVWMISEEAIWTLSAHWRVKKGVPDPDDVFLDLFDAETGGMLACVLSLIGDKLPVGVTAYVEKVLHTRIVENFLRHDDYWWIGDPRFTPPSVQLNNWTPWIVSNILYVTLHDKRSTEQERRASLLKLSQILDRYIAAMPSDGGCDEGSSYWAQAGGALCDALYQLYTADSRLNFFDEDKVRPIFHYFAAAYIGDCKFVNFSDGETRSTVVPVIPYLCGKFTIDPTMMAVAGILHREQNGELTSFGDSHTMRRHLWNLFYSREISAAKPDQLPTAEYLSELQFLTLRAGRIFLAAKGGHNNESHNHNDVGNYIIFVDNKPLFVDIGRAVYRKETFVPSLRYTLFHTQSSWHNLPEINGVMQSFGGGYRATDVTFENDVFSLSLEKAYPESSGLLSLRRKISLDREKETLMLCDFFCFEREDNLVTEYLLTPFAPTLAENTLSLRLSDGMEAAVEFSANGTPLSVSVEEKDVTADRILHKAYPDGLYRIKLSFPAKKTAEFTLQLKIN